MEWLKGSIGTYLKVTRAVRFQGKIPMKFWGICVQIVVYLINRLPSTVLQNMSAYEKLYNKKPVLTHLKSNRMFEPCKEFS